MQSTQLFPAAQIRGKFQVGVQGVDGRLQLNPVAKLFLVVRNHVDQVVLAGFLFRKSEAVVAKLEDKVPNLLVQLCPCRTA